MTKLETYRVRFRFRLQKKLNIPDKEYTFEIDSHKIVLSSLNPEINICDSEWLVMNARGFSNAVEANRFAAKLKFVCEVSSVSSRLGVDAGIDIASSGFGQLVLEKVNKDLGIDLRSNVHGVDVFVDRVNIRIANINATATVCASRDPFLADLCSYFQTVNSVTQETRDTILLLNYALMHSDPVAQIVFSISAVEMLGQNERWSHAQEQLIKLIAASCKGQGIGTEDEQNEVAEAIEKGLFKLSIRQGVLRLLRSLGLSHLGKKWDQIYKKRSSLVHGLAPTPGVDYSPLAHEAVSLCGCILLTSISKEIPAVNKHIDKFYSI